MSDANDAVSRLGAWREGLGEGKGLRAERPRYLERQLDDEVDAAMHKLLRACLDQRRPSKSLVKAINHVLPLVGHPLALKKAG